MMGRELINTRLAAVFGVLVAAVALVGLAAGASTMTRVSVSSAGAEGNFASEQAAISADGRYVAFQSEATNLVPNDKNSFIDIFVHDRRTGETTRVSVSSTGAEAHGHSYHPAISANGRFVAFASDARDLVPDDANGWRDVFIHDRENKTTTRISIGSNNREVYGGWSDYPAISADGRYVAFQSDADGLVPGDTFERSNIYIRDRKDGRTTLISANDRGEPGNGHSYSPSISADGRIVAYASAARNLIANDNNNTWDIFVHDRETRQTTRASVDTNGNEGQGASAAPAISADGRFVAFESDANNLVADDGNQVWDILVHDRLTGTTTQVSAAAQRTHHSGAEGAAISAEGRYVAFMVGGNVYVYDQWSGTTTQMSVSAGGSSGNGVSTNPALSDDGLRVAFQSEAGNLVGNNANGHADIFLREWEGIQAPPPSTPTPPPATPPPSLPITTYIPFASK